MRSSSPLVLAALVAFAAAALPAQEPTGPELLARAVEALGGEERLAAVEGWRREGTVELRGLTGTLVEWAAAPNRLRYEIDLNIVAVTRGYDGAEGWEQRDDTVKPLSGEVLEGLERSAVFQPILAWHREGTPVASLGRETVDGRPAWVLEVRPEGARPERIWLDADSYLPLRRVRTSDPEDPTAESVTRWSDWREVAGVMVPFERTGGQGDTVQTVRFSSYAIDPELPAALFANPRPIDADAAWEVTVSTIPSPVYKQYDGLFGDGLTESWAFHLVVDEAQGRRPRPVAATIELYAGDELVRRTELGAPELAAIEAARFRGLSAQPQVYDLRHQETALVALEVDRMEYHLTLATGEGEMVEKSLSVPLARYAPRTTLIYPVRGRFMVAAGHALNEPHKQERSQHFADDILVLDEHYALCRSDCATNADYHAWGAEIIAPAAGTVVYARGDIADNAEPGTVDLETFTQADDPAGAVGGNNVVIDHGNGEYSFLAHMQEGSVRVEVGDRVEAGQVLGLLGNSGNSDAPHLHYHLMAGPRPFQSDGLPTVFENVEMEFAADPGEPAKVPRPRRGLWLIAR